MSEQEDAVEPQDAVQEAIEETSNHVDQESHDVETESKQVPLSALQKERKKRQELELELEWERKRAQQAAYQTPQEDDNSRYESATREDLSKAQQESIRIIEEKLWIKQNPEKYERLNEDLPQFLKQRPHLAHAINLSSNRYEEAYTLMNALTPREQKQLKAAPTKKDTPNSPGSVPKAAMLNETVDVMTMNDDEFRAWRQSQKKRR